MTQKKSCIFHFLIRLLVCCGPRGQDFTTMVSGVVDREGIPSFELFLTDNAEVGCINVHLCVSPRL